jgi:hypothetical protein
MMIVDVVGLTSVDSRRLFVLRYPSEQQIEVYETTTFKLLREIRLESTMSPLHAIQLTSDQFVVCTSSYVISILSLMMSLK